MESEDLAALAKKLLAEAQDLQKRTELRRDSKESSDSIIEELRFLSRTLRNTREGWRAFSSHILAPLSFIFGPPLRFIARNYRKLWNRFAFITDGESGERILSRRRAGVMMVITFLVVMALTPTGLGNAVRFFTIEPLSDAIFIAASLRTETFYLNHSEEVDPAGNVHAVRGCHNEGKCEEQDAVYFRVRPRLSHDFWKLWKYGNPIYVPDHVVAPIAPGVNRCEVTYYGYRITSSWIARLLRSLQFYPTMLEASCKHLAS